MAKHINILIPVFNEEKNILAITEAIQNNFGDSECTHDILFVNDGSRDASLEIIKQVALANPHVFYLSLSRNFGKDNAVLAGMQYTRGDAVITIDADMQHPPELIAQFIEQWSKGYEVVYTYRQDRNRHASSFNQLASRIFYKLVNKLSSVELEDGIADFRLMDRKVVDVLRDIHEDYPFFRGLVKWVGFNQIGIPYTPHARFSGETKYNTTALLRLALHGLTSFSTKPLTIAIYLGFASAALSLLYIPYVLISYYYNLEVSGWSSLIVTVAFFGGLQLMILGILGLYLGKVFMQTKNRPGFIIKEKNIVHEGKAVF